MSATATDTDKRPYKLVVPPREFFRQFSNLAHNRVLNQNFPHVKNFNLIYRGFGSDFIVNVRRSISVESKAIGKMEITTPQGKTTARPIIEDSYATFSEVKINTAYCETSTEARFNSKGVTKLWTNWGVHNVGKPLEFVSVVKSNNNFTRSKAWVAAYYTRGKIATGTRFQVRRANNNFIFNLAEKLTFTHGDLWGGAYVDVNLTNLKLSQYNAIFGYNVNKNIQFYAEHATSRAAPKKATQKVTETTIAVTETTKTFVGVESITEQKVPFLKQIGFGKGTLTGAYKNDKIWALAQLGWEEPNEKFTFEAGVVYTHDAKSSFRAKVDQDLKLSLSARHRRNKNIIVHVGTQFPLRAPEKFFNAYHTIPVPFGVALEFIF